MLFPKASELALNLSGGHSIPFVVARLNQSGSALDVAGFHFVDDIRFVDAEYVNTQCSYNVTISSQDTILACNSVTLNGPVNAEAWRWSTGASTRSIMVTQSGTYWLGARDACCTGGDTVVVIVEPVPQSGFSSIVSGLSLSFTDTSSGSPSSWLWDFGDGNTSNLASPNHTYAVAGTYTVCLSVSNNCGTDSVCQNFTVACQPPQAGFSVSSNLLSAAFTDMTSGSTPTTWFWDFGDGGNSSLQNPNHTYVTAGTYYVCLTVANACNSSQFCDSLTIVCPPPTSGFSFQQQGQTGTVAFADNSSGSPTAYQWDFGDGNISTQLNPIHTYTASGQYTVCLTVSNLCGLDTTCQVVNLILQGGEAPRQGWLELSPVPAADFLRVRAKFESMASGVWRVYDLRGKLVCSGKVAGAQEIAMNLDVSSLGAGMYFLEMRKGANVLRKRFVKE